MARTLSIMAVIMLWKDSPNVISISLSMKRKNISPSVRSFSHFRYSIAIMRYLVNKIAIIGIGFIDGLVQTSLIKFIKLNCIRIMKKTQKAYK